MRAGTLCKRNDFVKHSAPRVDQYEAYPLLTAAETAFLLSEAALKGWDMGASAEELYKRGVTLSFEQWGVAGASEYLNDNVHSQEAYESSVLPGENIDPVSTVKVAWDDSDAEANLERIMVQKYLAQFPLGHETWCDCRRTGYPKFFPVYRSVAAQYKGLVVAERIPFSVKEKANNAANVAEAETMLSGNDDFTTKLWWAKK